MDDGESRKALLGLPVFCLLNLKVPLFLLAYKSGLCKQIFHPLLIQSGLQRDFQVLYVFIIISCKTMCRKKNKREFLLFNFGMKSFAVVNGKQCKVCFTSLLPAGLIKAGFRSLLFYFLFVCFDKIDMLSKTNKYKDGKEKLEYP